MSLASVYLVTNLGSFKTKIGISSNPGARLAGMQTGSPEKLYLVWQSKPVERWRAALAEKAAHAAMADWHLHGEWFEVPYDMCVEPIEVSLCGGALQ